MIAGKVIAMLGDNPSPYVLTFVVFVLCCLLTNFMSNTATTALMAPICMSIAQGMGADPRAVSDGVCNRRFLRICNTDWYASKHNGRRQREDIHLWITQKLAFRLILVATVVSMIILPIALSVFSRKEKDSFHRK